MLSLSHTSSHKNSDFHTEAKTNNRAVPAEHKIVTYIKRYGILI